MRHSLKISRNLSESMGSPELILRISFKKLGALKYNYLPQSQVDAGFFFPNLLRLFHQIKPA